MSRFKYPAPENRQKPEPKIDGRRKDNFLKMMMPNQILDFYLDGNPLILAEWKMEN